MCRRVTAITLANSVFKVHSEFRPKALVLAKSVFSKHGYKTRNIELNSKFHLRLRLLRLLNNFELSDSLLPAISYLELIENMVASGILL